MEKRTGTAQAQTTANKEEKNMNQNTQTTQTQTKEQAQTQTKEEKIMNKNQNAQQTKKEAAKKEAAKKEAAKKEAAKKEAAKKIAYYDTEKKIIVVHKPVVSMEKDGDKVVWSNKLNRIEKRAPRSLKEGQENNFCMMIQANILNAIKTDAKSKIATLERNLENRKEKDLKAEYTPAQQKQKEQNEKIVKFCDDIRKKYKIPAVPGNDSLAHVITCSILGTTANIELNGVVTAMLPFCNKSDEILDTYWSGEKKVEEITNDDRQILKNLQNALVNVFSSANLESDWNNSFDMRASVKDCRELYKAVFGGWNKKDSDPINYLKADKNGKYKEFNKTLVSWFMRKRGVEEKA